MLENSSIICFSKDWGGDPTSNNHIMWRLAAKNRILWVNSIAMRRPSMNGRDLKRLFVKLGRTLGSCRQLAPNIHVLNPLVIPLPAVAPVVRLNNAILAATLRRTCRRLGLRDPILWSFFPNIGGLVGKLGERLVVYQCVDDHAEFSGMDRASLRQQEHRLLAAADLVFTSSELLCRERGQYNPNTVFIPHGVDFAHFSRAVDGHTSIVSDLEKVRRPIIGFIGALADFVDLDLVADVARLRPDWSFVMVGRRWGTSLNAVSDLPNVHLLGPRPYESLPSYCRGFDVGIIPFRINNLTVRANPLKLREYLAAGLPVVSTSLPEVAKYHNLVRIAHGRDEFVREIEQALKERGEPFVGMRLSAMRQESWDRRVEQFSEHVEEALRRRQPQTRIGSRPTAAESSTGSPLTTARPASEEVLSCE
jgi:glycosyltransferase involved in cell wall biosynthesis